MDQAEYREWQLAQWAEWYHSQIEAWNAVAKDWPTYQEVDVRTHQTVVRCRECHQSIYFIDDPNMGVFEYSKAEITTLFVAHIRQVHGEEAAARSEVPLQGVQESRNESEV